jgi:uncharacterized protein (TIGR03067 family)
MRPIHVFALAVGLLALGTAAGADEKADKNALKELEGTYLMIGLEAKGLKLTEDDFKKTPDADRQMVIKGDQIVSRLGGKDDPATIKVDAAQKPARIDITSTKGGKTEVNYGIYKLENGVLTICATVNADAKDRPKEFKADDKVVVLVLKKQPAK